MNQIPSFTLNTSGWFHGQGAISSDDLYFFLLTLSFHCDLQCTSSRAPGPQLAIKIGQVVDGAALQGDQNIAGLNTGLRCRAFGRNPLHYQTAFAQRLAADAQP